jgi:hypothetical protein
MKNKNRLKDVYLTSDFNRKFGSQINETGLISDENFRFGQVYEGFKMHNLRMIELTQKLLLVDNGMNTSLCDHSGFEHLFHGVQLFCFLLFNFPDFTKSTPSNNIFELKVGLADFCILK